MFAPTLLVRANIDKSDCCAQRRLFPVCVFRNVPLHIRNIGAQCRTLSRLVAQIKLVSRLACVYAGCEWLPCDGRACCQISIGRLRGGLFRSCRLEWDGSLQPLLSCVAMHSSTAACLRHFFFFLPFSREKTGNEARRQAKECEVSIENALARPHVKECFAPGTAQ